MQTHTSSKKSSPVSKSSMKSKAMLSDSSTDLLRKVLADSFILYMKTYAVHWNYQGPKFFSVHKLTEEQYGQMEKAIDEMAERIRAKGGEAPFSLAEMLQDANLHELSADGGASDRSVHNLADSHVALAQEAHKAVEEISDEDPFTADMLILRIGAHEKAAWMLRSLLAH